MSFLFLFRQMWYFAENDRFKIVIFYILHFISLLGVLGQPYAFGQMFNVLQRNSPEVLHEVSYWLGVYVVLFFVFNVFHRIGRHIEQRVAFRNRQHFINILYDKLLNLPLKWHSENHSGATINRIKISSDAIHSFSEFQFKYIEHFMMFWGPLIILTTMAYQISLAAFILAIITIYIITKFDKLIVPLFQAENETTHSFFSVIFDYISNIRTIITLRVAEETKKELNNKIEAAYPVLRQSIKVNQYKWATVSLLILIIEVGIIFYYIHINYVSLNHIMLGSIAAIFQYLQQLGKMFFNVTNDYQEIVHMKANFLEASNILNIHSISKSNHRLSKTWKEIRINNLDFSYNDKKKSLHNINLFLKNNSKIALVGHSGSGKSTILSLLRGLYQPDNRIDLEIDQKSYKSLEYISSTTTLIPQDPEIFENTVKYNITFGAKEFEEDINISIELAQLKEVINKLPKNINTDIREKGVNLSGGEKQRLALARGILAAKNNSILLLDEPTSSIDSYTEELIYKGLFKYFSNKCIISSVHRLHLLDLFDYIYVISNGQIVQKGTLEELKKQKGQFLTIWKRYMLENKKDKK